MPRLNKEQRIWVCEEMARLANAAEVVRRWPALWPDIPVPNVSTIKRLWKKFENHGTCLKRNQGNSGRPRTARNQGNLERVRESLAQNGARSSRRNGLGLTQSSFVRIVKEIRFHPFVVGRRQKLENGDPAKRLEFCNWILDSVALEPDMISNFITSDEAVFSLNSEVIMKNDVHYARFGSGHPEHHYVNFKQGAGQLMVWVGLTKNGNIFGPHFVQGTLDTTEYLRIIRYHVIQREFREQGIEKERMWWQQDGASAHTSNRSIRYLQTQFPGKVVSKKGDILWPPHSPDLAICDFFLWSYLKNSIWKVPVDDQPKNLAQLREAIIAACHRVDRDMISRSFDAMLSHCRKCIENDGHTFQNE